MAPCTGDAAARSLDVLTRIHMHRSISKKLQRGDSRRTSISCTVGVCFTVLTRLFFGRVCVCVYSVILHCFTFLLRPLEGCEVLRSACSFVCGCVCLSAHVCQNCVSKFHAIFCTRYLWPSLGSLRRKCNMLCTYGFVGDAICSHNGPNADTAL